MTAEWMPTLYSGLSVDTVKRGMAIVGIDYPEAATEELVRDGIIDLLVLAYAAGLDWRHILERAEIHAAAETDSPDCIEADSRLIREQDATACERCRSAPIADTDSGLCHGCTANNDGRVVL